MWRDCPYPGGARRAYGDPLEEVNLTRWRALICTRWGTLTAVAGAAVLFTLVLTVYCWLVREPSKTVPLQLAGSYAQASTISCGMDNLLPCAGADGLVHDVHLDWLLIFGYGISTVTLCLLGTCFFHSRRTRAIARVAAVGAVIAVAADAVENLGLYLGLFGITGNQNWPWTAVAAAAAIKFAVLLPVAVVAATSLLVHLGRLLRRPDHSWTPPKDVVVPPAPVHKGGDEYWPPNGGSTPDPICPTTCWPTRTATPTFPATARAINGSTTTSSTLITRSASTWGSAVRLRRRRRAKRLARVMTPDPLRGNQLDQPQPA